LEADDAPAVRVRAATRFVRLQVQGQRSALPGHSEPCCSEAVRCAGVAPKVLRAVAAWRRLAALLSAETAVQAAWLAQQEASARAVTERRPEELDAAAVRLQAQDAGAAQPEERDAAAARLPVQDAAGAPRAERVALEEPRQEAAVRDEGPQQGVERDAAAVLPVVAVQPPEALDARQVALGAGAVRPSPAVWTFLRVLPLAPLPAELFARATEGSRMASRKEQLSQAAQGGVWS
jgi:hypothetical protein